MTDSELLALAARAHGDLEYVDEMGWIHVNPDGTRGAWWNPFENDGDAFRLAVKWCAQSAELRNTFIFAEHRCNFYSTAWRHN